MTTENENIKDEELNEAELSDVKNSIASLCKKYLTGSFFDKLVDTSGIKIAKDILLGDLKNMIGKGTSGPAAKKFAIAIQMAKNPVAVDTIMSNYMLKGDGMGSGIGYSESAEIQGSREYLTEAKKGGCCGGKKKPSKEEIEEAIKVVEAEGYKVSRLEESKEDGRPSYYDHPLIMAITYKGSTIYCGAEDGDMWSNDIEDAYVWDSFDTISTIAVENFVAVAKEALETRWISEDNVEYLPAPTDTVESKKSESLTLKQKELKNMARYGEATDITTISDAEAKELKKKGIETVGISRGAYGMNGALLRDNEGNKYVITARSSNLFYFV